MFDSEEQPFEDVLPAIVLPSKPSRQLCYTINQFVNEGRARDAFESLQLTFPPNRYNNNFYIQSYRKPYFLREEGYILQCYLKLLGALNEPMEDWVALINCAQTVSELSPYVAEALGRYLHEIGEFEHASPYLEQALASGCHGKALITILEKNIRVRAEDLPDQERISLLGTAPQLIELARSHDRQSQCVRGPSFHTEYAAAFNAYARGAFSEAKQFIQEALARLVQDGEHKNNLDHLLSWIETATDPDPYANPDYPHFHAEHLERR